MILYYEKTPKGQPSSINFYAAYSAFLQMGFEMKETEKVENVQEQNMVVGSIRFVYETLLHLGLPVPQPLDYPESLKPFLGRNIWESTMDTIASHPEQWNVFVKPKGFTKKFTGKLIQNMADLRGMGDRGLDTPVWVSEPVHFLAEWRVFIKYGRIIGVHIYRGDWRLHYDVAVIQQAVAAYTDAPNGYALDFGVTADGKTLLVEANDGYSLGYYGLFYVDYAKLLAARWTQLTNQEDFCNF
jgi:hypothetical protein